MATVNSLTPSKSVRALFSPFTIHRLTLDNRIVMAPMTRSHSPGAIPGPDVAAYYRRRAENGVGLILTEGTAPDHPAAVNDINVPNFHGDEALAGWARVVSEVHAAGGRIMPQFWHVGMMRKPGDGPNPEVPPVGPSGLNLEGQKVVEPITEAEIQRVIEGYARSAGHAKRLGFDGLEIHAAHGYLIDQFFWDQTNRRTDKYGGSVANRARFGAEVVRACRQAAGPDFPILLRFSQWKIAHFDAKIARTPEELAELLEPLAEAGVDVFHCSQRRFWEPEFEGSPLNLAGWTKKLAGKPTITVGSVGLDADFIATFSGEATAANAQLDRLIEMVETGEADLVAVGRALLSDPAWASKVRDGRIDELAAFNPEALKVLI